MNLQPEKGELCVIIGAGPAGLTAAHELARLGMRSVVVEKDSLVGGISRTINHKGYRCDIGGHRFFTKVRGVRELWEEIMGDDFLVRPRLSRIYYKNRFFDYPLRIRNTLKGLGLIESFLMGLSYIRARLFPEREVKTFEQWVSNRFGRRLFGTFFKSYTEKVWGMSCSEISADWARQRIKNLDFMAAVRNALIGATTHRNKLVTSLIDQFQYPRLGSGMMWERLQAKLAEKHIETRLNQQVIRVHHAGGRVTAVTARDGQGRETRVDGEHFIASMPLRDLIRAMDPPPPQDVGNAADSLHYRDFITVMLVVDAPEVFQDNWIYVHSPEVKVGRIQNFKNWSPEMVPDPSKTSLGLEYFAQEGDELWTMSNDDLIDLARSECVRLGFATAGNVMDGAVIHMPKAYPVYDSKHRESVGAIRNWIGTLRNLHPVGRNGQHRYNNMDHSMASAMCAARVVRGAEIDLWDVGVDEAYLEEPETGGDVEREDMITDELIRNMFAKYDAPAMGTALGLMAAIVLFLMSMTLILKGGDPVGPTLMLLGNFLPGYRMTLVGAVTGALEAGGWAFLFGILLAHSINLVVGMIEGLLLRRIEIVRTIEEGG
jgi:protoporphyrinogen oxidase